MAHVERAVAVVVLFTLWPAGAGQAQERVDSGRVGAPPSGAPMGPRVPGQALGAGAALDRNLQIGSGGFNPAGRTYDFAGRNNVVTDNVVGGRGFRGTVGYGAVGDFSVDEEDLEDGTGLGSQDINPFLADSALSSISALTLGKTYERIRYSQELARVDFQRTGASRTVGDLVGGRNDSPQSDLELLQTFQRMQQDLTNDRLTAGQQLASRFEFSVEGAPIGFTRQSAEDGTQRYQVFRPDSLRGVNAISVQGDVATAGLTAFDAARYMDDISDGRVDTEAPRVFEGRYTELDLESARLEGDDATVRPGRVEAAVPSSRMATDPFAEFKAIQAAVAERMAAMNPQTEPTDPEDMAAIEAEIQDIREMLAPHLAARAAQQEADTRSERERILDPDGLVPDPEKDPEVHIPDSPGAPRAGTEEETIKRASELLSHGRVVDRFVEDADNSRFAELMRRGVKELRDGRYFVAERQFEKARVHAPGHPFASIGLVHARIGAELYPGAAAELRRMLSERPELIDTRYDESLAPAGQDLRRAIVDLRERVEAGTDPATFGILLAYVGRLVGEDDAIRIGLDAAEQVNVDDPLVALLRRIWLHEQ